MRGVRRAVPLLLLLAFSVTSVAAAADSDGDGLRDSFEKRHGLTSARDRDSDSDGVIDGAEDSDGDRLSDRAEQRYGTHPGVRDTDGDRIPDGQEDADGDGRSNAIEQDQRPIPNGLRPSLAAAPGDVSPFGAGCRTGHGKAGVVACSYGPARSQTTIALIGDSHAVQVSPPLVTVARDKGWRLTTLMKRACPLVLGIRNQTQVRLDDNASCRAWRRNVIARLRRHPPDLIILAYSDSYGLINAAGARVGGDRRAPLWRVGMQKTVVKLPAASEVLVLGDVPDNRVNPVRCLKQNPTDVSACVTRRKPLPKRRIERAVEHGAKAGGARFQRLYDQVCPYDPCPVIQGDVLVYRDRGHLTAAFARRLTPTFRSILLAIIGPAASHARWDR